MDHAVETVALYWDFENLHASLIDQAYGTGTYANAQFKPQERIVDIPTIIEFALSVGPIAINRAFANWVSFNRYKTSLLESAIELIQVFPPGANAKNGADIKLCLDVMDDMTRFPHIGTIIVVGGDSDYMPLSYKVKAAGRTLIGIGSIRSTNQHWARSCHEFKFYESLLNPPQASGAPVPVISPVVPAVTPPVSGGVAAARTEAPAEFKGARNGSIPPGTSPATADESKITLAPAEEEELRDLLVLAVTPEARQKAARDLVSKALARLGQTRGEQWIQKVRLRPFILRMDPTFNESNFGFRGFSEMIASMPDLVEVRKAANDHELRLRNGGQSVGG